MRRVALAALSLALSLGAARANMAPPPLEFINVSAGGLSFLVIRRDYTAPAHPTAQLVGCDQGRPNCALARARDLVGKRVSGLDGEAFRGDQDLGEQILAAFRREGAPATIELDFEPATAGGAPIAVPFARAPIDPPQ